MTINFLTDKIITGIITLGSLFYSTINGVNAEFDPIEFFPKSSSLTVSTKLINCFTPEFEQIILAGQPVRFYYSLQIVNSETKKVSYEKNIYHQIQYFHLDKQFTVYTSENQVVFKTESFERAKEHLTSLEQIDACTLNDIKKHVEYKLKVSAHLDKIFIQSINKEINLMFYWNSIKPEVVSNTFTHKIITR